MQRSSQVLLCLSARGDENGVPLHSTLSGSDPAQITALPTTPGHLPTLPERAALAWRPVRFLSRANPPQRTRESPPQQAFFNRKRGVSLRGRQLTRSDITLSFLVSVSVQLRNLVCASAQCRMQELRILYVRAEVSELRLAFVDTGAIMKLNPPPRPSSQKACKHAIRALCFCP